jgi:hypothetical protein
MNLKLFFVFSLACFSSYYFTDNKYVSIHPRLPSSVTPGETRNSYANLPCPTEHQFMQWSTELNLDKIEGPSLDEGCQTKTMRVQLAQVLALANQIKIDFPKNWAPSVQAEIANSYEYIRQNTNILKIDLTQTNSVARNYRAMKQIELGGLFFKEEPLEALSVLIHEARHSDTRDPGHTLCRIGDIPKTGGGCDDTFSIKAESAGAYGYGTLYELALAQYSNNLDKAEKELMLSNAFTGLSTRFNNFRSHLARHFDIATVLLEDGTLAWVNPYSLKLIPINVQLPKFQEKFKKIEFSPRTNSLLLFTESDRLFVWGPRYEAKRPSPEATTEDDKFSHISRQYVPNSSYSNMSTRSLYVTLKTSGQLEFIEYDAQLNKYVMRPYPLQRLRNPNPVIPNLKYFVLAHNFQSYFLDKQGVISKAPFYGNEDSFIILDPEIQSTTGGWKTATGGVFYEDLTLTDADGKLYNVKLFVNDRASEDEDPIYYQKEVSKFQAVSQAKKYHEGLQIRGVLDENGTLSIENYRVQNSRIDLKFSQKIVDFVITRTTAPEASLYKSAESNTKIVQRCNIRKVIENVGYGSVLGLTADGRLVSANSDNSCNVLSSAKWTGAEVKGTDDPDLEKRPYPDVYLRLSNQNDKQNWVPYTKPQASN